MTALDDEDRSYKGETVLTALLSAFFHWILADLNNLLPR